MHKYFLLLISLLYSVLVSAQNETLRLDYMFSGTSKSVEISLDGMSRTDGWAGRRHNLDTLPLRGNGQIIMTDVENGNILYMNSFSSLFQEWQTTEESECVRKSFENVFLVPMPPAKARIEIRLFDFYGSVCASLSHIVDPDDILIRKSFPTSAQSRYLMKNGTPEDCIDVVIVAEGYTSEEMDVFYEDAAVAMEAILSHSPFDRYKDSFNFLAVGLESADSGVSVPKQNLWKDTAIRSNFDTFYMDRYLTTIYQKNLHDKLSGLPYEHIIILANTDNYGGGGIYNAFTLTTAHHRAFRPVAVHEFGHSFAGLADEYHYDDMYIEYYYPEAEPWEQNITTMFDIESKWKVLVVSGEAGIFEGAGYQSKGVFRGAEDCRMHTNTAKQFCPVCQRAIERLIRFYLPL